MKTASETAAEIAEKLRDAEDREPAGTPRSGLRRDAAEFILPEVERAIEDAFRLGFEHAVAGGEEANGFFARLETAAPLVLYFKNEVDRREMIDALQAGRPDMIELKIPERRR